MSTEIERKYLVKSLRFKDQAHQKRHIRQGFLNSNKNRVVRVRIIDDTGYITVKGITFDKGTSRFEWEKKITKSDAEKLLLLCESEIIEKNRFFVSFDNYVFEIDEFLNNNKGLIIAEIELKDKNEDFKSPDWLGKEVTGKKKYYNARLSKYPYNSWHKKTS
jgi:CYTH domain-containing protein